MTNDELQAHIKAIVGVFEEGILEECVVGSDTWLSPRNSGPLFNGNYEYRIAPKPLECWCVADAKDIYSTPHKSQQDAKKTRNDAFLSFDDMRVVHMREVTE